MTTFIPRIEPMPDQHGQPGFLLVHPMSQTFQDHLRELVPAKDLFWSVRPAGWWIPERHRPAVQELTRNFFGYVQVVHPDGRVEHDLLRPERVS